MARIGLTLRETVVNGHPAQYGVVGSSGDPVVFLHGWGLAQHSYERALQRLVRLGVQVFAPSLPGFGGTDGFAEPTLSAYSEWVAAFMSAVGIDKPVTLVGHSFGGGVAIRTAYDHPDRVARLVIVNSIGGSAWTEDRGVLRAMSERPLWDWGLHLQADIWPLRQFRRVVPVIVQDAVPNLIRNPRAIWRVAHIARTADLTAELQELRRRELPVVIIWGRRDTVIPYAAVESVRAALGDAPLIIVPGNHTWLLADPAGFGEVMTNVIGLAA